MAYVHLVVAIVIEVAGTTLLRMSDGFQRPALGLAAVGAYGVSLVLLSRAMQTIPMTVSYPSWAGLGTALTVGVGLVAFGERLNAGQWLALALTVVGVALLHGLGEGQAAQP